MSSDSHDMPDKHVRPEARENNATFVLRDQIVGALEGAPMEKLQSFLSNKPVAKFVILTDYCFHDSYANDAMIFSIVKGGELLPTYDEFSRISADLKSVNRVDEATAQFLRDSRFFTVAFILQRKAKLHATREAMLRSMDLSIRLQETWVNAATHKDAIKRFKVLREEAKAKGFNQLLYDRILFAAMFAAIISALIIENNPVTTQAIGWFSDRDAIVEKGTTIATHFYSSILNDYCIEKSFAEPTLGVIDHTRPEMTGKRAWFDPLIRIADHFAGPLAQINYDAVIPGQKTTGPSVKYGQLLSSVFADNPRLLVIRFRGKEPPFQVSLVTFSHTPPS
jgi:hypothetical protein